MVVSLTIIDRIALALYTIYLGGVIGGVWLFLRSSGRHRIWGIVIVVESAAAILLLTLMSTDYWISNTRSGIINVGVRSILYTLAYTLLPVSLGAVIVSALAFITIRLMQHGNSFLSALLLCGSIPIIFSASLVQLISLTKRTRPNLPDPVSEISIHPDFSITPFITEPTGNPTSVIFGANGSMYIANHNGDIWFVSFEDRTSRRFASGFMIPVGLAWRDGSLYVSSQGKITALRDTNGDQIADDATDIVVGLPAGIFPWHGNNGLAFGSDGRLYFPVGSTSDAAPERYQYAASILSVNADGSDLQTYAVGIRNSYRLAFNSLGDLFATDNAPGLLDVAPPDELNYIVEGGDYGFPRHFGLPPPDGGTIAPIALFPEHSSADGLVIYQDDQFPAEYFDNGFVTLWSIGQIYRVQLSKDDNGEYHTLTSIFVTGLTNPLDIATGPDGSLYVTDFGDSVVYKISYTGGQ